MQWTKAEIAGALEEAALLMNFQGENTFKVRAFENGARTLLAEPTPLEELLAEPKRLESVKGIGKALAELIRELGQNGHSQALTDLRAAVPAGLLEVLRVPNLGPKKTRALHEQLGVTNLNDLQRVVDSGELAALAGFGTKSAENIRAGLEQVRRSTGLFLLSDALSAAEGFCARLRNCAAAERCEVAGSLRRMKEVVHDVDLVCATRAPEAVAAWIVAQDDVRRVLGQGTTKVSVLLHGDLQIDVRLVTPEVFGAAWLHFTGSKEHNTQLRSRAKAMGLRLSEYGLQRSDDAQLSDAEGQDSTESNNGELIAAQSEEDVYRALGLAFVEPEMREGLGEVELAAAAYEQGFSQALPTILRRSDYRGVLHCHTTWSDGQNSVAEMCSAARDVHGLEYFAVCDHSEVAVYARGVRQADLPAQHAEIEAVQQAMAVSGFRLLKGTEVDILADGALDYPDEVLASMDIVVASVHSRFQLDSEAMTERLLRAVRSPFVNILGHPSGRLLLGREGYTFDLDAVLRECAATGTAVEINCDPRRLDLDWRLVRRAKELGCRFSINPDAHSVAGLANIAYGIGIARKGWLEPEDVLNCWGVDKLLEFVAAKRLRC